MLVLVVTVKANTVSIKKEFSYQYQLIEYQHLTGLDVQLKNVDLINPPRAGDSYMSFIFCYYNTSKLKSKAKNSPGTVLRCARDGLTPKIKS